MAAIKGKNTSPEMAVRRLLHAAGYRYRLHAKDLPGRPDIVLPGRRKVIEVRGCFWHRHGCSNSVLPKTRTEWWQAKLDRNVERDVTNQAALAAMGWDLMVVWECEVRRDLSGVSDRLARFLGPAGHTAKRRSPTKGTCVNRE